ncbi:hypothetical protein V8E53_004425 [Lactarius tabidus]
MSKPTTSGSSPSATPPSTHQSPTKNKPTIIIIVAVVGGILLIVALVLIIVPLARRRAARRRKKQAESSSSSDVTSTTVASRREAQNRTLSVDASVPLLEPDTSSTSAPEYSRFDPLNILTAQPDAYIRSGSPPTPSTGNTSFHSPRLFAPSFSSFAERPPPFADLEPGPPPRSRFIRSAPQQPLRHTRTRIARMPMDTLPEDLAMDTTPLRSPSPTVTRKFSRAPAHTPVPAPAPSPSPPPSPPPLLSHASSLASTSTSAAAASMRAPSPPTGPPSPTNWLHIPKNGGIPLISAFRQSISSIASRGSSLPTMQHYPSFSQSQNALSASGSTRSSQTFYSVGSARHGAPPSPSPPPVPPLPSEHGELPRPPPPRLKPGGGGERVTQVHLNAPDGHHAASRQASMVNGVPGSLRPGAAKSRPVSSTAGSGSSMSLYADARSQIGGVGEDGKWNGSANGSVGGSSVRGRGRS